MLCVLAILQTPRPSPIRRAYGIGIGGVVPLIETNNTLSNPSGPEYQFLVGEGTYVLKEDLHLATPPPHPSEAPVVNPNPLATNPQPATAGTKMSILSLETRPAPFFYKGPEDGRATSSEVPTGSMTMGSAPAFGEGNSLLAPTVSKDINKKKKPKNNVTKSNSSFISRVIVNDNLTRKLTERPSDGLFAFANINRAFQWLDMSSSTKQDYLTKILFTKAHCLCHDVNMVTKSVSHIDVIMGFSTGEIIWWEPISQRYTRLNKNGIINNTPVSEIRWIPGSENLFLAAHMDGLLVVYDKEKEDGHLNPEEEGLNASGSGSEGELSNGSANGNGIRINKSVHSKNQKTNPVAAWKLSNQRINAFAFSPDNRHLAVVSEDGTLRVIDYLKEELLDLYYSYYGGYHVSAGRQMGTLEKMADFVFGILAWACFTGQRPLCQLAIEGKGSSGAEDEWEENVIAHPVQPRAVIPMLPPVLTHVVDTHPACWLAFTEDAVITSCKSGVTMALFPF
ncbi:hypothetical protein TrVFT333_004278 [Trichoderma virens FT-333]|nr:hypothetical protein TrVFT333_004278 [Trichoderma virens FT-333]